MKILNEKDPTDQEVLVFALTVINKTLNGVPDQASTQIPSFIHSFLFYSFHYAHTVDQ